MSFIKDFETEGFSRTQVCESLTAKQKARLTEQLAGAGNPAQAFHVFIGLLRAAIPYRRIVFLAKKEGETPKWVANFSFEPEAVEAPLGLPRKILEQVFEQLVPLRVTEEELCGKPAERAFLFLPLDGDRTFRGAFIVHTSAKDSEDSKILPAVAELAQLFAAALSRAMRQVTLEISHAQIAQYANYFESILDNMAYGMLVLDSESRVVLLNKNAGILLDPVGDVIPGKTIKEVFPFTIVTALEEIHEETLKFGFVKPREIVYETEGGWELPLELSASLVKEGAAANAVIVLVRSAQVSRRLLKLEEMDRLKASFVSTVSHELRSPLTSIREGVELLRDGTVGPLREEQGKLLNIVYRNVDWLTRLINDLLDMSALEAGKVELARKNFDILELINDVISRQKMSAGLKKIYLSAEAEEKSLMVFADPARIEQVLVNLLTNALKFTPEGGEVTLGAKPEGDRILVFVRDTGCGMTPEDARLIFDKFVQVGKKTSSGQKGTGLGLSICKEILRLHQQEIGVDSVIGKGTTFKFTLEPAGENKNE